MDSHYKILLGCGFGLTILNLIYLQQIIQNQQIIIKTNLTIIQDVKLLLALK
jgi:hypothetical protein